MNLKEQKLELSSDLDFKIFKQYFEIVKNRKYKAVLIIQFNGDYGEGSGGNKNSEFMKTIISASLGLFLYDSLILDFKKLNYTFGDSLGSVLSLPKKIKGKTAVPKSNLNDVLIEDKFKKNIEVIPVETLTEVIDNTLAGPGKKELLKKLKAMKPLRVTGKVELESEKKMTASKTDLKKNGD